MRPRLTKTKRQPKLRADFSVRVSVLLAQCAAADYSGVATTFYVALAGNDGNVIKSFNVIGYQAAIGNKTATRIPIIGRPSDDLELPLPLTHQVRN